LIKITGNESIQKIQKHGKDINNDQISKDLVIDIYH